LLIRVNAPIVLIYFVNFYLFTVGVKEEGDEDDEDDTAAATAKDDDSIKNDIKNKDN
jgi:hypothetical protein